MQRTKIYRPSWGGWAVVTPLRHRTMKRMRWRAGIKHFFFWLGA